MTRHYLDRLFAPRSVAVFGASDRPDSIGGRVLQNIAAGGFRGALHPVNPKHTSVAGRRCYASIEAVAELADLGLVATSADTVPEVIRQCGEHGVRAAVVYSAGFGETAGGGRLLRENLGQIYFPRRAVGIAVVFAVHTP